MTSSQLPRSGTATARHHRGGDLDCFPSSTEAMHGVEQSVSSSVRPGKSRNLPVSQSHMQDRRRDRLCNNDPNAPNWAYSSQSAPG
jgi:hypothetical protein